MQFANKEFEAIRGGTGMNWIEITLGFILWLIGIVVYLAIFGLSEEPGNMDWISDKKGL